MTPDRFWLTETEFSEISPHLPIERGQNQGRWAFTLQGRIQEIATQQAERAPRLAALEHSIETLSSAARDPSSKPETKVEISALKADHEHLDDRVTRLEERVNNLHNYMMALPVRPGPYAPPAPSRRGDLQLDMHPF